MENNASEEKFSAYSWKETQKKMLIKESMNGACSTMEEDDKLQQQDNINNIKRIRIDEDSKNARMQSKLKMNTTKNFIQTSSTEAVVDSVSNSIDNTVVNTETSIRGISDNNRAAVIRQADQAWQNYIVHNRSVIVDTYQGQFRSTVSLVLFSYLRFS